MNFYKMDEAKRFLEKLLAYGLLYTILITFFTQQAMAFQALPRSPKPAPKFPKTQTINPKPHLVVGTKPKVDLRNVGELPDLVIMRGAKITLNPRVIAMCKAGKKDRVNGSIPVLNFSFRIKNKGKGTAYMNRDGVIVSAQQTNDFHERVFSASKYYLGGKGGPGHFINSEGRRQNWILKKMAHLGSNKIINATSHLGISYNNRTFTLNRLQELAGQTHKFLLKLTSYGNPGFKESNSRNNTMLVSYTFPRNFCKTIVHPVRPVTQEVGTLLPDLKIIQIKPKLHIQAIEACKTGRSAYGRIVGFNLKVKNIGKGEADLSKYYFAVHATSLGSKKPAMTGGDAYSHARRTPAKVAPGEVINITGASGVLGDKYGSRVTFPVNKYSKLAGKTRLFKVELITGKNIGHGLIESNDQNNSKSVSFTFPRNFCRNRH